MTRAIRLLFCSALVLGIAAACGGKDDDERDGDGSAGATPGGAGGSSTGGTSTGGTRTGGSAGEETGGSAGESAVTGGSAGESTGTGGGAGETTATGGSAGEGTGGAAGAATGGTAGTGPNLNCQGVNDDADCADFGVGYECDRSSSTVDPRICTCDGSIWACEHLNATGGAGGAGAGGAGTGGAVAGGAAGASSGGTGGNANLNCQGVNDNDDCTDFGAGYECDRTSSRVDPRICTCDGSVWTCEHLNGAAGTGAG